MTSGVDVRRAGERFRTHSAGVDTRHSFSFGSHWDPANTSYGPLLVHDEHRLEPGGGFAPHHHRDLDIVTWVVEGELVHEGDDGRREVLGPGTVAHLHAGRGVVHAERAGRAGARFVQVWLSADGGATHPSYVTSPVAGAGGLVEAVRLAPGALHVARLTGGEAVLPPARQLHAFVVDGVVELRTPAATEVLGAGDAARIGPATGAVRVRGTAEVLVWALEQPE